MIIENKIDQIRQEVLIDNNDFKCMIMCLPADIV